MIAMSSIQRGLLLGSASVLRRHLIPRDNQRCHQKPFDEPELQARLSITLWSPAWQTWPGFRMPLLEVQMTEVVETGTTRRRRRQTARNTNARASSPTRRGRSARQTTEQVLADLDRVVSALIKENRELTPIVERAAGHCEICGAEASRLICHERWEYEDAAGIAVCAS